jgi:surface polysaccharide O-acyltransferase-like enzyme
VGIRQTVSINNVVTSNRIESVDVMRAIAIMAVILLHTVPFGSSDSKIGKMANVIICQLAKFAVPFFL